MALIADQKTLGGEPVVTLAIGGHTLTAFLIGYEFEERCQRAGGLRIWLDNRGDEFDDLAADYPGLVRGAATDLRRGLAAGTVKLPRCWIDGLRYVFVEGAAMLELECLDWWDHLDRWRYNQGQIWTNTEVRTIVSSVLSEVGLTIAAGDFGVAINFGISVRRGGDEAVRDAMSRVQEYLYSDEDGHVLHKQLDPAEASGYTYDWSAGGGANHPLLKGTQISEQSLRFNKITVVGGGNWEYVGSALDAAEAALVNTRERTLSDGYLSSDAECLERAQAELRYWQAQKYSGTVVARPHFTLRLYDVVTVGAPAWGGPARTGRVMGWKEEYGRQRGMWEQRITVGEVAYLAMGSSGLGYGAIVGEHIDSETGLIVSAYKVRQDGEIVQVSYATVEEDWGTEATHEAIGHGAAEPEAMLQLIAKTYDGGAHGGVASVTITLDTEAGTVRIGGAYRWVFGTAFQEMTEQAADPSAPGFNRGRLYLRDDGAGNTQLCIRFNTGDIIVLSEQGLDSILNRLVAVDNGCLFVDNEAVYV